MVAVDERGARPGVRGKLTRDPAVETAAVALSLGFADPLAFLSYDPDDYTIAVAVLRRAQQLRAEELKWFADYVSARTAGMTAQAITKWLGRAFKSMTA